MHLSVAEIIGKLKQVSLFSELDEPELKRIAEVADVSKTINGQNVIKEGDNGSSMYVLYKGFVEIKKRILNEDEEYTVINLSHKDNAFFGELALLDRDSRSATVTAKEDSILIKISSDNFDEICNEFPAVGYKIYHRISKKLSKRLRKANQDIVTLFEALVMEIRKES